MTGVTRAIIPCGGRGTRMLAVTGDAPKEMLRVAGMPIVERVARECAASGITDLLVVIGPEKSALVAHLAPLARAPGMPIRIEFTVQSQPLGLADAIRRGRAFVGNDVVAVALPDNLFMGPKPALREVIDVAAATGKSTVAVVGISARDAPHRGATAVYSGEADPATREFRIASIPNKGAKNAAFDTKGASVAYTGVGRYVFTPELWTAIEQEDRGRAPNEELDDVPVMQRLLSENRLTGCLLSSHFLDTGVPAGYKEAKQILHFGSV